MKTQLKNPGRHLIEALTSEQLESLLDTVGSKTLLEKIDKKCSGKETDMAATVKKVLTAKTASGKKNDHSNVRMASDRKIIEAWNELWSRWNDIVFEVGDEDGKYAVQERHWEPPYFDGTALAADLENVAVEMEKMIDRVYEIVNCENVFADAVEEINRAIDSYPDWMGEEDGCSLEFYASRCVLRWLWLSSRTATTPGTVLLDKIESIDADNELVQLDRNAIIDVIAGLPEPVCREIYAGLSNARYSKEQENVYSPWNALMLDFKQRYDKNEYLNQCSRDLEKNWTLGRPLIEKALADNDLEGAEKWLIATFSAYIHDRTKKSTWFPEKSLLDFTGYYLHGKTEYTEAAKLLLMWSDVSKKMDNKERAIAARFQAVVLKNHDGMERVADEYIKLYKEYSTTSLDLLFRQWQDETARKSFNLYREKKNIGDTWVHWMLDAKVKGKTGILEFRNRMKDWLECLIDRSGEFKRQQAHLACLTADLAEKSHRTRYDGLFSTALQHFRQQSDFDKNRNAMARALCPAGTIDTVLTLWKKHFVHLVPDPSSSGSDYQRPVMWITVLYTLNADAYTRLITRWKQIHHRRRNLWKALGEAGLPCD